MGSEEELQSLELRRAVPIEAALGHRPMGARRLYASWRATSLCLGNEERLKEIEGSVEELRLGALLATSYREGHDSRIGQKLEEYVSVWDEAYQIDEGGRITSVDQRFIYGFLHSYALICADLSDEARGHVVSLATKVIRNELCSWSARKLKNGGRNTLHNNHAAYSNMLGLVACLALKECGSSSFEEYVDLFVNGAVERNIEGFFDHVRNNSHPDGSSLDFHQRDSVHYHIFNQIAWERSYKLCRELGLVIPEEVLAKLFASREFAMKFISGRATHLEFVGGDRRFRRDKERWPDKVGQPFDSAGSKVVRELLAEISF